jgi:hypothetical protein
MPNALFWSYIFSYIIEKLNAKKLEPAVRMFEPTGVSLLRFYSECI